MEGSRPDRGCDACCAGRCSTHSNTLGYELMRLPTSSQGTTLFWSLSDLSQPWESLGRIYEEGLVVGWLTSIGYDNIQRQAWQLISGPCLSAKARFLSINRTQSRAVTGLLTGHNTLRRHLRLIGLSDSPLCRRCGAEKETSAHILSECEPLASLRHVYLGSSFLEPEKTKSISLGAIWNFCKATGLP